eukprot:gnl/MRDRNA2_/MRDRNA2_26018_c0_seq1.p1 gnl/MRDRNA2_/MRDRNA2_26018_c0~~gnl/MRDRNA2_/MRDRNA2_26018_c0_seq1.p1  ORF type:complete len:259 (-),score=34.80 gnl/MRDRNA2_/MRDRNA2_26018_c0_seq1:510-1247(-)
MTISVKDLSYNHDYSKESSEGDYGRGVLKNCTFEVSQGTLIALVGPPGKGKTTLLKLLGGALLPDDGEIHVPPHLRVFHVSPDALFIEGSLMKNLTLGCLSTEDSDAKPARVIQICRSIGLREKAVEMIHSTEERNWSEVLSASDRQVVHLARALIANPEVLVIHKPTLMFDEQTARLVFKALRVYVDEQGIEQDPSRRMFRRPRTCICTITRPQGIEIADKILLISEEGARELAKNEVTELHMH